MAFCIQGLGLSKLYYIYVWLHVMLLGPRPCHGFHEKRDMRSKNSNLIKLHEFIFFHHRISRYLPFLCILMFVTSQLLIICCGLHGRQDVTSSLQKGQFSCELGLSEACEKSVHIHCQSKGMYITHGTVRKRNNCSIHRNEDLQV